MSSADLYRIAREITDEVCGHGTYAELHKNNPDPAIQAEVQRGQEGET